MVDNYNLGEDILKILLKDRTTNKNIIWGTDDYSQNGIEYYAENHIELRLIEGKYTKIIEPRVLKDKEKQDLRTKDKAEVFTPSWVCNNQNNMVDEIWFGKKEVFNTELDGKWNTIEKKIEFPKGKSWEKYVELVRMEMTCGEAPYLVSRYDTVTGKKIKIEDRIGLLDRKLRVIGENIVVEDKKNWIKWVTKAFKTTYGFEYQGDNLIIARKNLLYTLIEYYTDRFGEKPENSLIKKIANIISWNIWQMDGISMTVPYCSKEELYCQMSIFGDNAFKTDKQERYCIITDWTKNKENKKRNIIEYRELLRGKNE